MKRCWNPNAFEVFEWDYSNSLISSKLQTTRPLRQIFFASKIERISMLNKRSIISIFEDDPLLYKVIRSSTTNHFLSAFTTQWIRTYNKLSSICYLSALLRHFLPHVKSSSKAWIWHDSNSIPLRTICCRFFLSISVKSHAFIVLCLCLS